MALLPARSLSVSLSVPYASHPPVSGRTSCFTNWSLTYRLTVRAPSPPFA